MLNRNNAPALNLSEKITIPAAKKNHLNNNTPVIILNSGTQEVIKIELVFEAGSAYTSQIGRAHV